MSEFEVPPGKLQAMRQEHLENTYLGWVEREADSRCLRYMEEHFTDEEIDRFFAKVHALGGMDQMHDWIIHQPAYGRYMRKVVETKAAFLEDLQQLDRMQRLPEVGSP